MGGLCQKRRPQGCGGGGTVDKDGVGDRDKVCDKGQGHSGWGGPQAPTGGSKPPTDTKFRDGSRSGGGDGHTGDGTQASGLGGGGPPAPPQLP